MINNRSFEAILQIDKSLCTFPVLSDVFEYFMKRSSVNLFKITWTQVYKLKYIKKNINDLIKKKERFTI